MKQLHEAYLAKATELLAKAKVTREVADKAKLDRIAAIYFRLAAKAERSTYGGGRNGPNAVPELRLSRQHGSRALSKVRRANPAP
jgi:hypothetical protein